MDSRKSIISDKILQDFGYKDFIFDSSSLIYTYKADILSLVLDNFNIYITKEVVDEINNNKDYLYNFIKDRFKLINNRKEEIEIFYNKLEYNNKKRLTFADLSVIVSTEINNLIPITEDKNIIEYFLLKERVFLNSLSLIYILLKNNLIKKDIAINKIFEINRFGFYSKEVFSSIFNLILKTN
ncbi:MAG: hypothetical protein N3A58_06895 [Spirochaetes bacterium]|nr:hypothetical protein [Spirochaetota bacterium]